jgi:hypothetical protein
MNLMRKIWILFAMILFAMIGAFALPGVWPSGRAEEAGDGTAASRDTTAAPQTQAEEPPAPAVVAEPAIVAAYTLQHARAESLAGNLTLHFGTRAKIQVDAAKNTLLVAGSEKTHREVAAVLSYLDRAIIDEPSSRQPGDLNSADETRKPTFRPNRASAASNYHGGASRYDELGLGSGSALGRTGMQSRTPQDSNRRQIDSALRKLREAKSDAERETARSVVRRTLADIFQADMEARRRQAAEIESRLTKLRQQYEEREKVKDTIIDLQLKVLENDAAGLGFPNGTTAGGSGEYRLPGGAGYETPTPGARLFFPEPESSAAIPADQFDPVPKERTLADTRKANAAAIEELETRGHFIVSTDGTRYAYVNSNRPNGPSIIRVVDSATGVLLGTALINSLVGPIEFTAAGVATRESDGVLKTRVPLTETSRSEKKF